jgi:nucleoside-diphosphate-sugar epimerase
MWPHSDWRQSELFVLWDRDQLNIAINKMPRKSFVRLGLLARLFQDLKLLFPLIKDYLKGTYRHVSVKSIVIFIITLAYIISPIDLIPDYILGFGQIDDAADAHLLAADKLKQQPQLAGKIYFISQGEPIAAWDMINAILQAAGLEPVKGTIPFRTAWLIGALLEFFYKAFHIAGEPPMTRFLAEAVAISHWFDISAAQRDLDYRPQVTTAEGLQKLEDWLKTNYQKDSKNATDGYRT